MSVQVPSFEPAPAEQNPSHGTRLKATLALGAGGALGCAHIGVILALQELGVQIDAVAGSSMGAIVGAFLAAGKLKELEDFLKETTWMRMLEYGNFSPRSKGWVDSEKLENLLNRRLEGIHIENMPMPYAAVAMEWGSWEAVLLQTGSAAAAAVASSSIPGVFPKKHHQGRTLVDGGFTNMVPVFAARELSEEKVIAVGVARGYPMVQQARRRMTEAQWEKHRPSLGKRYMPELDFFLSLDHGGGARYDNAEKFIEAGYQFVMKNRQFILSLLAA